MAGVRKRVKKTRLEKSTSTIQLECAGCGKGFRASEDDWIALGSGHYVHWGKWYGEDCYKALRRRLEEEATDEARSVDEEADEEYYEEFARGFND